MTTLTEVLRSHGVDVAEAEVAQAVIDGFTWMLTAAAPDSLPSGEATLLDDAGLVEVPGAYARSAVSTAGAYVALASEALTVREAADRLGITPGRVRHRIADRELHVLASGTRRLPSWQFTSDAVLPGLPTVLRAIPQEQHPLGVLAFMTTVQPELEVEGRAVAPVEWLRGGGDPAPVAELAASLP